MSAPDARSIVITGATNGMGRALAEELIARGLSVWGCGRTADDIARLNELRPGCFRVLDIQDEAGLARWAAALDADGHVPDLLINNAAVMHWLAPFCDMPAEAFDRTVDINLKGAARVLRAFLPALNGRMLSIGRDGTLQCLTFTAKSEPL
jgi:NAD(P)-dependent dehydrogenase (short-subunit alcohol dehydrogenase family)